jgi:hypothetical protein
MRLDKMPYSRSETDRGAATVTTTGGPASAARQFAAEPWWIAGGSPWEAWDRHYAERAEVILIFELYDVVAHRQNGYAAYEVRERHRDKTFVVLDPKDRKLLRATRAIRATPENG